MLFVNPTPLPKNPTKGGQGSPKEWGNKALVSLSFQTPEAPMPITTYAVSNGSYERTPGSLQTAIDIARERASKHSKWSGSTGSAHAVLQAADGAYYITALVDGLGLGNTSIDNGLRDGVKFLSASPAFAAVKAIVGASSWVDFTTPAPTLKRVAS